MADFGLVYPFVVVTSKGGPYDDQSFVAGVRYGQLDHELAQRPAAIESYEYPELVPQLDLLAMHHGYTMQVEPWDEHPNEWVHVTFTRPPDSGDKGKA